MPIGNPIYFMFTSHVLDSGCEYPTGEVEGILLEIDYEDEVAPYKIGFRYTDGTEDYEWTNGHDNTIIFTNGQGQPLIDNDKEVSCI